MNKTAVWVVVAVVIILGIGVWFYSQNAATQVMAPQEGQPVQDNGVPPSPAPTAPSPAPLPSQPTANVKSFVVTGDNYAFAPKAITVKKGDTVRITFKNAEGFHDLKIGEFNAATAKLTAGAEATIEFVADKTGAFEYYCSVGNHRAMGMVGTLTVE